MKIFKIYFSANSRGKSVRKEMFDRINCTAIGFLLKLGIHLSASSAEAWWKPRARPDPHVLSESAGEKRRSVPSFLGSFHSTLGGGGELFKAVLGNDQTRPKITIQWRPVKHSAKNCCTAWQKIVILLFLASECRVPHPDVSMHTQSSKSAPKTVFGLYLV